MRLLGDIESERLLYWKGFLFAFLCLLSGAGILLLTPDLRIAAMLLICVWSAARFYYFLFYVIERYADPEFRFAGIGSFLKYWMTRRRR